MNLEKLFIFNMIAVCHASVRTVPLRYPGAHNFAAKFTGHTRVMKVVLLGDACVPDDICELRVPWRRGGYSCLMPGDFAIMPFDRMDASLKAQRRLRAVLPCCDDPVASIREILAKDIVVIGRATRDALPEPLFDLFGKVCYVKCDARGHKGGKYLCTNNDSWYSKHRFLEEHNPECSVYFANKHEHGKPVPYKRAPRGVKSFGSEIQYKHMPDIKKCAPGWLTSGLSTAFHFLYETHPSPDTCIYMFRFSHWRAGEVVTPPAGMQNAFGRPPGRHDVDIERRAAEHLRDTGRVFPLELGPPEPDPEPKLKHVAASAPVAFGLPDDILSTCALIVKRFGNRPPETMLDIGCGMALEAEYFHKKHGTRLWLIEGDAASLTPDQKRLRVRETKFGPASDCKFAVSHADLRESLAERGVEATVMDPSSARSLRRSLPKFDLILSKGACGMRFPVGEYGRLMRDCRGDATRIVLELNQNRKAEHRRDGAAVSAVLKQSKKSVLAEVILSGD